MSRSYENIYTGNDDGSHYFMVHRPMPQEDLGQALRNAFRHQNDDALPPDLARLMGSLHQIRRR